MNTENKTVTIDARHTFSHAEMSELGIHASRAHREHQRTEEEMKSAAKDWKAKLDRIALDRDGVLRKLGDGWEMRKTLAFVIFNEPSPGRKTYRRAFTDDNGQVGMSEEIIGEDPMEQGDFQRDLPLDETPKREAGFCQHGLAWDAPCAECDAINDRAAKEWEDSKTPGAEILLNPNHHPEIGDSAAEIDKAREVIETAGQPIGTSIGDLLDRAAQGNRPNLVVIDFAPKDDGNKCLAKWRKAARNQGWPEPCIDLIDGIAKDAHGKQAVLAVLSAHSISTAELGSKIFRLELTDPAYPLAGKSESLSLDEWKRVYGYYNGCDILAMHGAKLVPAEQDDAETLAQTFSGTEAE